MLSRMVASEPVMMVQRPGRALNLDVVHAEK